MFKLRFLLVTTLLVTTSCTTPQQYVDFWSGLGRALLIGPSKEVIAHLPDGEHTVHYAHKNKKYARGTVKDGKREGPWTYYFINGIPKMKTTYVAGVMNGMTSYYWSRGWLRERGMVRNGGRSGAWESYDWGETTDGYVGR